MLQITAEEINYIIYQYLQESGFSHSAYSFGKESNIVENKYKHFHIPAGMLIVFLEKALTLIHIEAHYHDGDNMVVGNEPFTLLNPHHGATKLNLRKANPPNPSGDDPNVEQNPLEAIMNNSSGNIKGSADRDQEMEDESKKEEYDPSDSNMAKNRGSGVYGANDSHGNDILRDNDTKLKILESKSNKTLKVAWNPKNHKLVYGGDNGYATLWDIGNNVSEAQHIKQLPHISREPASGASQNSTTTINSIDWNNDGTKFITGASDGICRMWDDKGTINSFMYNEEAMPLKNKGVLPNNSSSDNNLNNIISQEDVDYIFDAKWNKNGSNLVTVSEKNNVILWNTEGKLRASYQGHSDAVTSIDWKNDNVFATGSQNGIIKIWDVQSSSAVKTLVSHESNIKGLQWDPSGAFLASGGGDSTIQIWNHRHDNTVISLKDHKEAIHSLKWTPTGLGTNLPNQELRLASCSADGTIKIWSLEHQKGVYTLQGHTGMVMCLDYDPSYNYLASGDEFGRVIIWSVKDGNIVKTFENQNKEGIFDAKWSHDSVMLATGYKDVSVIDIRYM